MKSKIGSNKEGIEIKITEVRGHKKDLLEAFQECQEGRCSCPTQEYKKVETIEIENLEDSIHLTIKAKNGEAINKSEIEKCLEHTSDKILKR